MGELRSGRVIGTKKRAFHFVVPGSLDQRTGGYIYGARMVSELRGAGFSIDVHSIGGTFPVVDSVAREALDRILADLDDGERVAIDGLASGGLPDVISKHAQRLAIVVLVHHPLADETGHTESQRDHFFLSEKETLSQVRGVIVTSAFTANRLVDFDVSSERIRVVEPGTDPAPLADGPLDNDPPRLVCVGSITPRKGQDLLVESLGRLRELEWRCVCAGSLSRDERFARMVSDEIDRRGLGGRIELVGELESAALEEVYRTASLFVLPSHYEGYGMAYAEALARGIPVVGTTGGAIPHTVPGFASVLVPPGDADALTGALEGLLVAPDRRGVLAEGARMHRDSLPTWPEQATQFCEAMFRLAGSDGTLHV